MGRGGDDDNIKKGCICCWIILIPSVIMFACSFSTLNPHQIGLHYNGPALTLDPETEFNGRHFLGLGHYFFKYPARLIYVEFSESADGGSRNHKINLWTRDGQEVFAEVGFYYRIVPEKLSKLYYLYGFEYQPVIENIATNAFRDVSTEYNTIQFFEERDKINDRMHQELRKRLLAEVHVSVPRFNLLSLDMPDQFEQAVVAKVIVEQDVKTLEFKKTSAVTAEETLLEQTKADKEITILRAQSTANGTLLVKAAEADAYKRVAVGMADLRLELAQALGLNETGTQPWADYDKLLHYMWLDLVRGGAGNADMLFNVKKLLVQK